MRKIIAIAVAVLAGSLMAAPAMAKKPHMTFSWAHAVAQAEVNRDVAFSNLGGIPAVGKVTGCSRVSSSRVDCGVQITNSTGHYFGILKVTSYGLGRVIFTTGGQWVDLGYDL